MLSFLSNKKLIIVCCFFICGFIQTQPESTQSVVVQRVRRGSLKQEEVIFKRAFTEAYKGVPLDVLKISDLESFLTAAFEDEPVDLNKSGSQVICFVAKRANEVVGVIFYEPLLDDNTTVYVRQLAVDPKEQRQGVGSQLMSTITSELPATQKIILATRRVNQQARDFYTKHGFQECKDVPHGLNPERYVGFEKNLK